MSLPSERKRYGIHQIISGGLREIFSGMFGVATPNAQLSSEVGGLRGLYQFHEGDLFTPGTGNWAMDPSHETPLATDWGGGFLYPMNQFPVTQPPQVYVNPAYSQHGIGGLIAGQMALTPLSIIPLQS